MGIRTFCIGAGLGAAVALGGSPCYAAASDLPPLVSAATQAPARLPGKMVFAALVTPDLLAAERFYASMFGWQFQNAYLGTELYGQASFGGRIVAAVVQRSLPNGQRPAWRTFLSSGDVAESVREAVRGGATVLLPPHQIANLGRDALLRDPQGAVFGLLESGAGDPADVLAAPGEWIWSTLVTSAPAADAAFYKNVLGYELFSPAGPGDADHVTLVSQGFARASISPIPTDHPVSHPRWISYVRVADMTAAIGQAQSLGARLVVPAHVDRNGGSLALLADPAGALIGLLMWSDDESGDTAGAAK